MFDRINTLISKRGFTLKSWNDRYGKGIWAVCTPLPYQADEICESSSDGDMDMIAATEYVLFTDWLPITTGNNLIEALTNLEERLSRFTDSDLSEGSRWSAAVWDALEHFRDVRDSGGEFGELPVTLSPTEAIKITRDKVTRKKASLITIEDELATRPHPFDGLFLVNPIRALEQRADGLIVVKHGPVGLAMTEYETDDEVEIVRR